MLFTQVNIMTKDRELIKFIFEIDYLTTNEFCDKFKVPKPVISIDAEESANSFLQIDAIKHRLFLEKAKEISRNKTYSEPIDISSFKEKRLSLSLTISEVAHKTGLSKATISRVENLNKDVFYSTLVFLDKFYFKNCK